MQHRFAQSKTAPISARQSPLTLSVTVREKKKLALPDTVCSPSPRYWPLGHPTTTTTNRSGDGQDAAGVPDSPHLIWLDNQPRNGQDLLSPLLRHNIDLKARDRMGGGERDADKMAQTRCCMTRADLISLPTCRKPHPRGVVSGRESCGNKTQTEMVITQRNPSGIVNEKK